MKQKTLGRGYKFWGKGLHTGCYSHMRIKPAPANTGIVFVRTDLGVEIPATAANVSSTARSTTLSVGKVSVGTVEHVLSALTGLGIDNAYIEIDNREVPILDGSAKPYIDAICVDKLIEQDAERQYLELEHEIYVENHKTGSYIRITPSEVPSVDLTIDFNSHVLGVQTVHWDPSVDYSTQIGPCRTFCFLHEVLTMHALGLVKGGDVENAIVIVEKPVSDRKIRKIAKMFGQPTISITPEGYLSNLELRFPDECGRHKLLDIMGDFRLVGGFFKAHVEAYKPGHALNTQAALEFSKSLK